MKIEGIYKVVAIVLIITMITGWYSGCISPDIKRDFFMGCVAVPRQPLDESSWINAFELLGNNAEFVLHHVQIDWELFENTSDVDINQSEEWIIEFMSKGHNSITWKLFSGIYLGSLVFPFMAVFRIGQSDLTWLYAFVSFVMSLVLYYWDSSRIKKKRKSRI